MDPITIPTATPQEIAVIPGKHYLVRAEDQDLVLKEWLDGTFEDLSENGTITAGESNTVVFNSRRAQLSVASGMGKAYLATSKVAS